jgi:hypothetical protein
MALQSSEAMYAACLRLILVLLITKPAHKCNKDDLLVLPAVQHCKELATAL